MTYASYPPYTLKAKASQIRERMAYVMESLTPELAESVTFKRLIKWPAKTNSDWSTDTGEPGWQQVEGTTTVARWRMFYIRCTAWGPGDNVNAVDTVYQALRVEVLVGIPSEAIWKYDPEDPVNVFDVEDIISHDEELLVDELGNTGIFGEYLGEPALESIDNIDFVQCTRSPLALSLIFTVRYGRTR